MDELPRIHFARAMTAEPHLLGEVADAGEDQSQRPPVAEAIEKRGADVDQRQPSYQAPECSPAVGAISEELDQESDDEYGPDSDGQVEPAFASVEPASRISEDQATDQYQAQSLTKSGPTSRNARVLWLRLVSPCFTLFCGRS